MPKQKSHSGAKKRFKVSSKGKVSGRSANTSHNQGKAPAKKKRRQARSTGISEREWPAIDSLLGRGS